MILGSGAFRLVEWGSDCQGRIRYVCQHWEWLPPKGKSHWCNQPETPPCQAHGHPYPLWGVTADQHCLDVLSKFNFNSHIFCYFRSLFWWIKCWNSALLSVHQQMVKVRWYIYSPKLILIFCMILLFVTFHSENVHYKPTGFSFSAVD